MRKLGLMTFSFLLFHCGLSLVFARDGSKMFSVALVDSQKEAISGIRAYMFCRTYRRISFLGIKLWENQYETKITKEIFISDVRGRVEFPVYKKRLRMYEEIIQWYFIFNVSPKDNSAEFNNIERLPIASLREAEYISDNFTVINPDYFGLMLCFDRNTNASVYVKNDIFDTQTLSIEKMNKVNDEDFEVILTRPRN